MAVGSLLRTPVRVADSYAPPGQEMHLFPNSHSFLTMDEVLSVFPDGMIPRDAFQAQGHTWRLAKRPVPGGGATYLAVLDTDALLHPVGVNGHIHGHTFHLPGPLRSAPIEHLASHDISVMSDISSNTCSDLAPHHPAAGQGSMHRSATMPLARQRAPYGALTASHDMHGSPLANGSQYALMASPLGASCNGSGGSFMTDLLVATETPSPLERYKAFIRLFSSLRRGRDALQLPDPSGPSASLEAWDSHEGMDHVKQSLLVGECLAKFGTADFGDRSTNSSRAITTKDYAKLLRMYLEGCGQLFYDAFIGRLPLALQDEALTVRTLLQTRCETNELLFGALVRQVGQERHAGGGAIVVNHSSVTANPTNHMLAAPKTLVNTVANAWSKSNLKRRTQLGALGAVAVVALWVFKKKLLGGGGGGGGGGRGRRDYEDSEELGGRRRRRQGGNLAERLLDERMAAERTAVRFLSACHDELRRAAHNDQLLQRDWRLGPVRLAAPLSGPLPPGYEPMDEHYCSLGRFLGAMDEAEGRYPARGNSAYVMPERPRTRMASVPQLQAPPLTGSTAGSAAGDA